MNESERRKAADQQKQTISKVIYAKREAKGGIERLTSLVATLFKSPLPCPGARPNWRCAPEKHTNNRSHNRHRILLASPSPRIAR